MRKHILLVSGHKHIHKQHIQHALHTHHVIHKHHGHGIASAVKKDVQSYKPPTSGVGLKKHHSAKRIQPLKFKL
jgi:hypothetical protein